MKKNSQIRKKNCYKRSKTTKKFMKIAHTNNRIVDTSKRLKIVRTFFLQLVDSVHTQTHVHTNTCVQRVVQTNLGSLRFCTVVCLCLLYTDLFLFFFHVFWCFPVSLLVNCIFLWPTLRLSHVEGVFLTFSHIPPLKISYDRQS